MKYLFTLAMAILPSLFMAQAKRLSLQAGISAYPEGSGWGAMHGVHDLDVLGPTLERLGFQVEQLRGSTATYGQIREALDRLLRTARPGDWVHLHFSLHGQQIPDDNQDEFDGLDEALVPFDAPASPQGAYTGERHLRDDQLQQYCEALGRLLGPQGQLWVTLDACHSGTATRSRGVFRGAPLPFGAAKPGPSDSRILDIPPPAAESTLMAPMVLFSGTAAHELNREYLHDDGRFYGPLSWALGQELHAQSLPATYAALFERMRQRFFRIAPRQTPQAEGDLYTRMPLYPAAGPDAGFPLLKVWDNRRVILGAGALQGLFDGQRFGLYASGSGQLLSRATLVRLDMQAAELLLDTPVAPETLFSATASPEAGQKNPLALRVGIRDLPSAALQEQIATHSLLQESPGTSDVWVTTTKRRVSLETPDGRILYQTPTEADDGEGLRQALLAHAKARYLRQLEWPAAAPDAGLAFHLLRGNTFQETDAPGVLQIGQEFRIELFNNTSTDLYFCLLDIAPDDKIALLQPQLHGAGQPGDWRIKAGQRRWFEPVFRATPPEGAEVLKLLLSDQPIYPYDLLQSRPEDFSRSAAPAGKQAEMLPAAFSGVRTYMLRIER